MNRHLVLALGLALPLCANAFQPFTRHIDGARITATRSASQPCGVDLDIALTDQDQRMVIIEYTYSGTFDPSTFSGVHTPGISPPSLWNGSRSGVINASMGRMTYLGLSHLTYADPKGLYCLRDWSFNFIARTYNASQHLRDEQEERNRKEQARIDEINRKMAEKAQEKQRRQQRQLDFQRAQEQARRDNLAAYRRSSPENARCIINEPADIARCEQAKARERADRLKLEADAIQVQKQREAEKIAATKQAAQFTASEEEYERRRMLTTEQKCAEEAVWIQKGPPTGPGTGLQLSQAQAQWNQRKAIVEAECRTSKNPSQAQNQGAQQLLAEQNRILAQQKAQADLDAAIQRGKITVNEAASNTQSMQNDNADLMNLINRMK